MNIYDALNMLAEDIHIANRKWWYAPGKSERFNRNKGELLALIHSEISECLEGVRKGVKDDHLTQRSMEEVEMADALIRIFDYCGAYNLDISGAVSEKLAYNHKREDHTYEARAAVGGKKF